MLQSTSWITKILHTFYSITNSIPELINRICTTHGSKRAVYGEMKRNCSAVPRQPVQKDKQLSFGNTQQGVTKQTGNIIAKFLVQWLMCLLKLVTRA
jgi:hypothetical protein